jgi:hypothetical protein
LVWYYLCQMWLVNRLNTCLDWEKAQEEWSSCQSCKNCRETPGGPIKTWSPEPCSSSSVCTNKL